MRRTDIESMTDLQILENCRARRAAIEGRGWRIVTGPPMGAGAGFAERLYAPSGAEAGMITPRVIDGRIRWTAPIMWACAELWDRGEWETFMDAAEDIVDALERAYPQHTAKTK